MKLDVSANATSCESLSFTGLVCIQDQHLASRTDYARPVLLARKASREFEFSHDTTASAVAVPRNDYSTEKMFLNDHLQPHAILFCSNQSRKVEQTSSKRVMPSAQRKNSISETIGSTLDNSTRKPSAKVRNRTDQKRTGRGQGFGQRIFKSLSAPCRDCQTIQPIPLTREHLQ